ncbi:glycosyltransferase, partial [Chloroflexota bacterium]
GDVQPYVALGMGLKQAGYAVRLAAPAVFADFVTGYGLEFVPLAGDPAELARALVDEAGLNMAKTIKAVYRHALPLGVAVYQQVRAACQDADAIIYNFLLAVPGHEMARARGVPDFFAQMYPLFVPTGDFPSMMFPPGSLGAAYNRQTHRLFAALFWQINRFSYKVIRRTAAAQMVDLPPLGGWAFADPVQKPVALFGWSPHVIPRPSDWPSSAHVTGFWTLTAGQDWTPPADLVAFLEDGLPPVYVGFGSVVTGDIAALTDLVLAALAQTGQRAILLGGWGGLGDSAESSGPDLPDTVYRLAAAPHDWLFPRMAAVVHHGGAGTTAAGLRAGVPSIIVPFASDQAYWGRLVRDLGVGPEPIPRPQLSADRLAYALRVAVAHGPMRQRAATLGAKIRAEDGVSAAVRIVQETLGDGQ